MTTDEQTHTLSTTAKQTVALVCLGSVVALTFARLTYPVLLQATQNDLLGSYQRAGQVGTANFGAYALGVGVVAVVSRRFEPITLVRVGLLFNAVGLAIAAVASGFWMLALGLVLAGAGSAGIWIPSPAIATGVVPSARRGLVLGLLSSSIGLGLLAVGQLTNLVRAVTDNPDAWRPIWAIEAGVTVW